MILAIVQARISSTRLPGKVMKRVLGKPLIGYLLERLSLSRRIDRIIVATTKHPTDDELCKYVKEKGFGLYRGSEENVLDRFYQAAVPYQPETVVRITADCPLIDYKIVDKTIDYYQTNDFDYVANDSNPPIYPDGMDTEVFSFESLKIAWGQAALPSEREHVTPYLKNSGKFKCGAVKAPCDFSQERWTVDYEEDFILIKTILENLYQKDSYFGIEEILKFKEKNPEIFKINQSIKRNEGYDKSLRADELQNR